MALSDPYYEKTMPDLKKTFGLPIFSLKKPQLYKQIMHDYGHTRWRYAKGNNPQLTDYISENILFDSTAFDFHQTRLRLIIMGDAAEEWIGRMANERKRKQALFVLKNLYSLPHAGILARNLSQSVYYDRCNLLHEPGSFHTTLSRITKRAVMAQCCYDSWEEYFTAFAMGEQFAHPEVLISQETIEKMEDIMVSSNCAVRYLPWDLKLQHDFFNRKD